MNKPILTALCLLLCCCGAHPPEATASETIPLSRKVEVLLERGDHQSASYYIEAQLQAGGDEKTLLPLLVETQIRGDLLQAAMHTLRRLHVLTPDNPRIKELFALLQELTGIALPLDKEGGSI